MRQILNPPGLWVVSFSCLALASLTWAGPADDEDFFRRLAKRTEPSLRGSSERLDAYVRFYRHELANDPRLFAFDVAATSQGDGVVIEGVVEFEEHRRSVAQLLVALGFTNVDNRIHKLPSAETPKGGVIRVPRVFSYAQPEKGAAVVTECLWGEPVFFLSRTPEYSLVHSGEGYLGYVPSTAIRPLPASAFVDAVNGDSLQLSEPISTPSSGNLPVGSRLPQSPAGGVDGDGFWQAQLDDGSSIRIRAGAANVQSYRSTQAQHVVDFARQFLGTPYVWGGKSREGVDCSGLVQLSYQSVGVQLPRDSNQQVYVGKLTGTRWFRDAMLPGDTMYFLGTRGRIRHTAIYLGDDRFVQAESPVASVRSLNPEHRDFDPVRASSFAFAKRPL